MLQRTKYSRLRNDSQTSLEDQPQGALPLKGELCLGSDLVQLDPQSGPDQGPSTLKGFIPRIASIRLHSPVSLLGQRGQATRLGDRTTDGHIDRSLTRADWASGHSQRLCSQTSLPVSLSTSHKQTDTALQRTKRPITLHRMASLPWTPGCPLCSHRGGPSCLKASSAAEDSAMVVLENRVVHHHIKVGVTTCAYGAYAHFDGHKHKSDWLCSEWQVSICGAELLDLDVPDFEKLEEVSVLVCTP